MIYSIKEQCYLPVCVTRNIYYLGCDEYSDVIRYSVYDDKNKKFVGYVDLNDTFNGAKVLYIQNKNPKLYKRFGQLADQIEVEHCLKRGIDNPYIHSVAARDTYVQHFLRGKRFVNERINDYLDNITKNLIKGEKVYTEFFKNPKMYMPANMINEIKERIKINPLLKGIR